MHAYQAAGSDFWSPAAQISHHFVVVVVTIDEQEVDAPAGPGCGGAGRG